MNDTLLQQVAGERDERSLREVLAGEAFEFVSYGNGPSEWGAREMGATGGRVRASYVEFSDGCERHLLISAKWQEKMDIPTPHERVSWRNVEARGASHAFRMVFSLAERLVKTVFFHR